VTGFPRNDPRRGECFGLLSGKGREPDAPALALIEIGRRGSAAPIGSGPSDDGRGLGRGTSPGRLHCRISDQGVPHRSLVDRGRRAGLGASLRREIEATHYYAFSHITSSSFPPIPSPAISPPYRERENQSHHLTRLGRQSARSACAVSRPQPWSRLHTTQLSFAAAWTSAG
jgi:hypothetical protein